MTSSRVLCLVAVLGGALAGCSREPTATFRMSRPDAEAVYDYLSSRPRREL